MIDNNCIISGIKLYGPKDPELDDIVKVVRCKYYINAICGKYGLECNYHGRDVGENDYCVWGERKE